MSLPIIFKGGFVLSNTKIDKDKVSRLFELHCLITDKNPKRNQSRFESSIMKSEEVFFLVENMIFEFMSNLTTSIINIEDIYELNDEEVVFLIDSCQLEEDSHLVNSKYLNWFFLLLFFQYSKQSI